MVTDNHTAQQLMEYLIGPNVAAFNPVLTCPDGHSGKFQVVNSNLPIGEGIVLSSGDVKTGADIGVDGPVSFFSSNSATSGPGDPDLDDILVNLNSNDACVLEFDFIPDIDTTSTLRFKYVFGSEEYNEYACTNFNDVFAFLLSGPGVGTNVNVALVPGTSIPVAINSVNSGVPGSAGGNIGQCNSMGPGSPFPAYFINNEALNGQTVTLDGFTVALEAMATVQPCDTYHIKLAVADVSDFAFNSAVFLQAYSFTVDSVQVNLKDIIKSDSGYVAEGCGTASITITRDTSSGFGKSICFDYSGTATYGVDYAALPTYLLIPAGTPLTVIPIVPAQDNIPEPGFEIIKIRRLNCCTMQPIDSIELKIFDSLQITLHNVDTGLCKGDSLTLHVSGAPEFNYLWSPATDIPDPTDTLTTIAPQQNTTFTIKASFLACPDVYKSFTAIVDPIPDVTVMNDTSLCLKQPLPIRVDVQPSSFSGYNYFWFTPNHLSDPYAKEPEFWLDDQSGTFQYVLAVQTPVGCVGRDTFSITAWPGVDLENVTADFTAKYGEQVQLNAEGAPFYVWTPDRLLDFPNTGSPMVTALDSTTFQVIGMNRWGCADTAYVKMNIDYTMFEILPNAFSPNGDGRNDVFKITNMKFQRLIEFRIFNRWGQEVFSTTDYKRGWDGTFKGIQQEAGVYQYLIRVTTPDGQMRTYKGDVSLIR